MDRHAPYEEISQQKEVSGKKFRRTDAGDAAEQSTISTSILPKQLIEEVDKSCQQQEP